jgi:eukaryotic translation initiation factor 2C
MRLSFLILLRAWLLASLDFRTVTNGGNGSPGGSDMKRMKRPMQAKVFKADLSFAAKIPMDAIFEVLRGEESQNSQEVFRVLDIILRQRSAKQYVILTNIFFP